MKKYTKQINQEWLSKKHHDICGNCHCGNESGETETLRQTGVGDIEICMDCYGALGYVY